MFLPRRFFFLLAIIILTLGLGYAFPWLFVVGRVMLLLFLILVVADIILLYSIKGIEAWRECAEHFSNGDKNDVHLHIRSLYPFAIYINVIDEIPDMLEDSEASSKLRAEDGGLRSFQRKLDKSHSQSTVSYQLSPVKRGEYEFGLIRVFTCTVLGLVERRYSCGTPQKIKVYPSFLMLHQYELLAISNHLTDMGIKRIRRIGNNTEFEQIKEYVQGNEYRSINWKASARRHQLMVNVYHDERSQQIFCCIDKGRVMQQAFNGMTLLDYSINASLVLSYVAVKREDKAGLITFAERVDTFIPASRQSGQMQILMSNLYAQNTSFGETDFSNLYVNTNRHVNKRSLMVLYTNFTNMTEMERQLPFLEMLSKRHRLLVVFFEDAELNDYIALPAKSTEEYYQHVIAEKFAQEKRMIVTALNQHGILGLLTTPRQLSVDVINKYLEIRRNTL